MENYTLKLPGNREDSIVRPNGERTEVIYALLLLLSTVSHIGFYQDGIINCKEYDYEDATMDDVMSKIHNPICRINMCNRHLLTRRLRIWMRPKMNLRS